jgi:hypothetical protein
MILNHFKINKKVSMEWKIIISTLWVIIVPCCIFRWILIPFYNHYIKPYIRWGIKEVKIRLKSTFNKDFREAYLKTGKAYHEGLASVDNINPYNLETNFYEYRGWNQGKQTQIRRSERG